MTELKEIKKPPKEMLGNNNGDNDKKLSQIITPEIIEEGLLAMRLRATEKHAQEMRNYEAGRVERVAIKYQGYFVHAIDYPTSKLPDAFVRKGTEFEVCVKMALALPSEISASFVRKGYGKTFHGMGLIISSGNIKEASFKDIGSSSSGVGKERGDGLETRDKDVEVMIKQAIEKTKPDQYNEFIIKHSQFAGMFIAVDENGKRSKISDFDKRGIPVPVNMKKILSIAKEFNLPVYVLNDGVLYEAEYREETDSLQKTKLVKPEEIVQQIVYISPEKREKFIQEILITDPFQKQHKIRKLIEEGYLLGEKAFFSLYSKYLPKKYKEKNRSFSRSYADKKYSIDIDLIKNVWNVPSPLLLRRDYETIVKTPDGQVLDFRESIDNIDEYDYEKAETIETLVGYKVRNPYNGEILEDPTIMEYTQSILKSIRRSKSIIKKLKNNIDGEQTQNSLEAKQLTLLMQYYHLFGLATALKRFGEKNIQKRIFKYLKKEGVLTKIANNIKKRQNDQRQFVLLKEDLKEI